MVAFFLFNPTMVDKSLLESRIDEWAFDGNEYLVADFSDGSTEHGKPGIHLIFRSIKQAQKFGVRT